MKSKGGNKSENPFKVVRSDTLLFIGNQLGKKGGRVGEGGGGKGGGGERPRYGQSASVGRWRDNNLIYGM